MQRLQGGELRNRDFFKRAQRAVQIKIHVIDFKMRLVPRLGQRGCLIRFFGHASVFDIRKFPFMSVYKQADIGIRIFVAFYNSRDVHHLYPRAVEF